MNDTPKPTPTDLVNPDSVNPDPDDQDIEVLDECSDQDDLSRESESLSQASCGNSYRSGAVSRTLGDRIFHTVVGLLLVAAVGVFIQYLGRDERRPSRSPRATPTAQALTVENRVFYTLEDGRTLFNVTENFLRYALAAKLLRDSERLTLWEKRLEDIYPAFFHEVLYRGKQGDELENYRQEMVQRFFQEVGPRVLELARQSRDAAQRTMEARKNFAAFFPDFAPDADYYLTVSMGFEAKLVEVEGVTVMALGLDVISPDDQRLEMVLAQEHGYAYLLKNKGLSLPGQGDPLFRHLWVKGLVLRMSEALVPGHRLSKYLGLPGPDMNEIHDDYDRIRDLVRSNLETSDRELIRALFSTDSNTLGIPPGAGLYLAENLMFELNERQGHSLEELAGWDEALVRHTILETLPKLSP